MSAAEIQTSQTPSSESGALVQRDEDLPSQIQARRRKLGWEDEEVRNAGTWGLALSGGGIRSATFCFGLLKALAKNKAFHRFDLMSTVSGGGYIGATVGKMFQNSIDSGPSAEELEDALADADGRWFGYWLRANGRYLIPGGTRDTLFAVANFARNLVGVHIEVALLGLLLGCLLVGVDLGLWQWADCVFSGNNCYQPEWVTVSTLDAIGQFPTFWLLLPPLMVVISTLAVAYWALPSDGSLRARISAWRWLETFIFTVSFAVLIKYGQDFASASEVGETPLFPGWLLIVAGGLLISNVAGTVLAFVLSFGSSASSERLHHRITAWLSHAMGIGLLVLSVGVVDMMAWQLAKTKIESLVMAGAAAALTVAVLRAVLPKIADLPRSLAPGTRRAIGELINAAGIAVLVMILIFWVSVVHRSVSMSLFLGEALDFKLAWFWFLVITLPCLLLMLLSFSNRDFLNRSSLFNFYRARLVRSYLGAGNVYRSGEESVRASDKYPKSRVGGEVFVPVQHVHADDDVPMSVYAPYASGGPIHLINTCINQTRDSRGRMFNRDRKGQLLTIGPKGRVRVGLSDWEEVSQQGAMTLGSWVAISGAAVAPGLGSSTKPGISALLTLAGVRLGYWWNALSIKTNSDLRKPVHYNKYSQLLAELRGQFEGIHRSDWFLSDGGHFENTAAYALLREECALIVIADCGADPRFSFGDLENLVRKARIDLQANIAFRKPRLFSSTVESGSEGPGRTIECAAPPAFGSLNDLVSSESQACLALARVEYRSGRHGYIVVVKPNLVAGAPVDLVNFKADHPLFPQEPTTDQFFSEAQWESYFLLGQTLGHQLPPELLKNLPYLDASCFEEDDGNVVVRNTKGDLQSASAPKRLPSRIAATGAVTASASLGALVTLGVTGWQAASQHLEERAKLRAVDKVVLKELTDLYGRAEPGAFHRLIRPVGGDSNINVSAYDKAKSSVQLGEMATTLLRVGDACNSRTAAAFQNSSLIQMILRDTKESCARPGLQHPACAELLNEDNSSIACLHAPIRPTCEPVYWARDFSPSGKTSSSCEKTIPSNWMPWYRHASGQIATELGAAASQMAVLKGSSEEPPTSTGANSSPGADKPKPSVSETSTIEPLGKTDTPANEVKPVDTSCNGVTVYVQIFGPELRDKASLLREPWRKMGASVPPIEDVLDTARRRDRSPPKVPGVPTVVFHDQASATCAARLKPLNIAAQWEVRALPKRLTGSPGVIEVWLPPGSL